MKQGTQHQMATNTASNYMQEAGLALIVFWRNLDDTFNWVSANMDHFRQTIFWRNEFTLQNNWINKKSWIIMIKLGGHVLRSPGRFTSSLWSWSRCQMKDILEIFIILKDWVLSVNRCLFTSRWSFPTLKMWFPGSNFGLILRYQPSTP